MANNKNKMVKLGVEITPEFNEASIDKIINKINKKIDTLQDKRQIDLSMDNIKGFGTLMEQMKALDTILTEVYQNSKLASSGVSDEVAKSFNEMFAIMQKAGKQTENFMGRLNTIGDNIGVSDVSNKVKRLSKDLNAAFKELGSDFQIDVDNLMSQDVQQQINTLTSAVTKFTSMWSSGLTIVADSMKVVKVNTEDLSQKEKELADNSQKATQRQKELAGAAKETASAVQSVGNATKNVGNTKEIDKLKQSLEEFKKAYASISTYSEDTLTKKEMKDPEGFARNAINAYRAAHAELKSVTKGSNEYYQALSKIVVAANDMWRVQNSRVAKNFKSADLKKFYTDNAGATSIINSVHQWKKSDASKIEQSFTKQMENVENQLSGKTVQPTIDIEPKVESGEEKKIKEKIKDKIPDKVEKDVEAKVNLTEEDASKKKKTTKKKTDEETVTVNTTGLTDESAGVLKTKEAVDNLKVAVEQKTSAFKEEQNVVETTMSSEISKVKELYDVLSKVKVAIDEKTTAFKNESDIVNSTVEAEVAKLNELENKLEKVKNNMKSPEPLTDSQDVVIENQHNQELEEKAKIYQRLNERITETIKLQQIIDAGNQSIIPEYRDNGNLIAGLGYGIGKGYTTDNHVTKTIVKNKIKDINRLSIENESGKEDKLIERRKDELAAYVATYQNLDEVKEVFGKKETALWDEIIKRIELAKAAKDAYEKSDWNYQFMREDARALGDSNTSFTFGDNNKFASFIKSGDAQGALGFLTEKFKIELDPEITSGAILEEIKENTGNTPVPIEVEPTVNNPSNSTPPITKNTEIQDLNQLKAAIIEVEREIALKTRAFNEESVTVTNVVSSELILLEKLKKKIEDIKTAVNEKTSAFASEQSTVSSVVDAEVLKLKDLSDKLAEIKNNAQSVKLTTPAVDIDNTKQTESAQEKLKGLLQELRTNGVTKGIDESTERTKKQIAQLIIQLEKYGVALDSILSKKDLTTLNAKKWGINDVVTDLKTPATDSIGQEIELVGKLKTAVDVVESAVRNKNKAFSDEQTVVKNAVDAEIQDLKRLESELGIVAEATNIKNTVLGTESSDNKKANSKKNTTQNKSNASTSTLSSVLVGIDGALSNLSSAIGTLNGKVGMNDRSITVDGISGIGTNVQNIYNILNKQQKQDVNLAKSINSAVEELRKASQGIAEDIQEKKTANEKDAAIKKKTYVREADPQMEAIQGVINTTKRKYNAFSGSNEVNGELKNDYLELIELINKARTSEEKLSEDGAKKIEDKCRAIQKEIDLREQNIIAQQKEATQEELAKKYEEKQKALQKSLDDISINGQADTDDLDKAKKKVAEIGKEIEKLRQKDDNDQIKILDNNELAESKENLKELTSEATKLVNTVVKDYNKTAFSDTYSEQLRKAQNAFKEFKAIVGNEQLSSDIVTQVKNYEAALKELEDVQQRLANKPASQLTTDDKTAWENAKKTVDEYEKSLGKLAKTYQEVQNAQEKNSIDKIAPDIDTNNPQQMFDALSKYAEAGVKARVSIGKLNKDGKSLNATFVDSNHKLQQITVTYDEFTRTVGKSITPMKKVETQWDKLVFSIGRKMREMVAYMASFASVYEVFNVIRQGVTYVKEIDDALTELKKVTDETDASYNKFLQDMSKTAATIGTTVKDLTSSAADGLIS